MRASARIFLDYIKLIKKEIKKRKTSFGVEYINKDKYFSDKAWCLRLEDKEFNEWISELKSRNDIVSIVSKYCNVTQKGGRYWTCCPFHMEKTPSMCIYDYEQTFHCYGCKEHGDVLRFVMKIESCDFMQAVEILAKNANMEVPNFSVKDSSGIEKRKKEKDQILAVLNEAYLHYKNNLYQNIAKPAQEYIKKRELTKRELESFNLGYSINYTEIIDYLKGKGFAEEIMQKAGIIEKGDKGNYYDVFAYRLMFPIFNIYNECIGFSGRILTNDKNKAKYRNSTNTMVFDKGKTVFGINVVRALKQKQPVDNVIIVEGQMDVIAMHKAGFKNAVACLGTAFTQNHAKQLKLISNNAVVCLDGDNAGLKAANKIVDILAEEGFNVRAVKLPEGVDPDEYIKEYGADKLKELIANAEDYIIFQIEYLAKDIDFSKSDEKARFVRDSITLLGKLTTDSERQIYLKKIKELSGIPIDILQKDAYNLSINKSVKSVEVQEPMNMEDGTNRAIKFILASMLYKKPYVTNKNCNIRKFLKNNTYIKLFDLIKSKMDNNQTFTISSLYEEFNFDEEPNLVDIVNYNFEQNGNNKKYYEECLWNLVEKSLKFEQSVLNEQFAKCTSADERKTILLQISNITKKLKNKNMEDILWKIK